MQKYDFCSEVQLYQKATKLSEGKYYIFEMFLIQNPCFFG